VERTLLSAAFAFAFALALAFAFALASALALALALIFGWSGPCRPLLLLLMLASLLSDALLFDWLCFCLRSCFWVAQRFSAAIML
jgi:hypothetical protein